MQPMKASGMRRKGRNGHDDATCCDEGEGIARLGAHMDAKVRIDHRHGAAERGNRRAESAEVPVSAEAPIGK
jgi:hypothetical protein